MKHTAEPQEWAIALSAKNGERDYFKYTVELFTRETYIVTHKEDKNRMYWVDLEDGSCDCPFCEAQGVCKHLWVVGETLRVEEMAKENDLNWEARADEYASPEYRRF